MVDPSEARPVLDALQGLQLDALWLTHHHWDHIGAIGAVLRAHGSVPVLASDYDLARERVPHQTEGLRDGQSFLWAGHGVEALYTPGHTLGALAYRIGDELFTGDTLFVGGCGRMFEGSAEQFFGALQRLAALPDSLRLWCGHNYAASNFAFAQRQAPQDAAYAAGATWAADRDARGEPTVPVTLATERQHNIFLRAPSPTAFAELRAAKTRGA